MEKTLLFVCIAAALGVQLCFGDPLEVEVIEVAPRIVNGINPTENQFPYAISLQHISSLSQSTRGHTCGGALVTLGHAVTSGSCLYTITINDTGSTVTIITTRKEPANYRVFAGANQLNDDTSGDRWRGVSAFTPHPSYTPRSDNNNIGVITLSSAFRNMPGLAPLAISSTAPADGALCTVAGWGSTLAGTGGPTSQSLTYTNRYIVPQADCSMMSTAAGGPIIQSHMLCAQFATGSTPSCTNDTGNALVCNNVLVGVLSWYTSCNIQSSVEVYTRTASFDQWLRMTSAAPPSAPAVALLLIAAAALTQIINFNNSRE